MNFFVVGDMRRRRCVGEVLVVVVLIGLFRVFFCCGGVGLFCVLFCDVGLGSVRYLVWVVVVRSEMM